MQAYQPKVVLDMATGTADLAILAAKKIPSAKFVGIDLSNKMIQVGQQKIQAAELSDRIDLQIGDSENIQFPDHHFDSAMVAFGVRNYQDLDKGLSELHRVLKKGAPLYVLEFSKPTIFPVKQVFNLYFKWVLPLIGRLFSKDKRAYTYLYDSVQVFPAYDDFKLRMEAAGFSNTTWEALSFGICCLYTGIK